MPEKYTGFGVTEVALTDGATTENVVVALEDIATTAIAGNVVVPGGATLDRKSVWLQLGPRTAAPLVLHASSDPSFVYATPAIPFPIGVQATASAGPNTGIIYRANLAANEVLTLELPELPVLALPAANALDISQTSEFIWDTDDQHISIVIFASQNGPPMAVYGKETITTLPPMGTAFPSATQFAWNLISIGPYDSMDAFTDEDGGIPQFGLGKDISWGQTFEFRIFTTTN